MVTCCLGAVLKPISISPMLNGIHGISKAEIALAKSLLYIQLCWNALTRGAAASSLRQYTSRRHTTRAAAFDKFAIPKRAAKYKKKRLAENAWQEGWARHCKTRRERNEKRATANKLACQSTRGTFRGLYMCSRLASSSDACHVQIRRQHTTSQKFSEPDKKFEVWSGRLPDSHLDSTLASNRAARWSSMRRSLVRYAHWLTPWTNWLIC